MEVDEFALCNRHVYATILVYIGTRRPIHLRPDRTVETVRSWLADSLGVKFICPDRSASYAEASQLGALGFKPVADRFLPTPSRRPRPSAAPCCRNHRRLPVTAAEPRWTGRLSDRVREQHAPVHALIREDVSLHATDRHLETGLRQRPPRGACSDADELLVGP
ncbi:hypothetical protein QFZ63_000157 [Streptomyces sp. B3I7]|uniref:transposase n=1 Tax=Streptomyces sp. B3I7 TaxID=3042269 RepID=UPI002789084B|nr:transposase [Streptomyces sp. B3I7]MDQ0808443.1 hypothetical protein [Streptomyces sp. B3I7]